MQDQLYGAYMHGVLAALSELYATGRKSEEGVVLTASYILARSDVGTTLTYQDLSSFHHLSAKALSTKTLCVGITAVTG